MARTAKGQLMLLDDLFKSLGVTPDAFMDAARDGSASMRLS